MSNFVKLRGKIQTCMPYAKDRGRNEAYIRLDTGEVVKGLLPRGFNAIVNKEVAFEAKVRCGKSKIRVFTHAKKIRFVLKKDKVYPPRSEMESMVSSKYPHMSGMLPIMNDDMLYALITQ